MQGSNHWMASPANAIQTSQGRRIEANSAYSLFINWRCLSVYLFRHIDVLQDHCVAVDDGVQ